MSHRTPNDAQGEFFLAMREASLRVVEAERAPDPDVARDGFRRAAAANRRALAAVPLAKAYTRGVVATSVATCLCRAGDFAALRTFVAEMLARGTLPSDAARDLNGMVTDLPTEPTGEIPCET